MRTMFPVMAVMAGVLFFAGVAPAVRAEDELLFEKTRLDFKVKPEDATVTAVFKFTNKSDSVVRVEDVHTNCGCIRANTDKRVYQPGEEGKVEAVFKVGSFEGKIEKSVTLQLKSKKLRMRKLTVGMEIPSLFEIEPPLTEWLLGEEPVTKTVKFKILYKDPVHITRVSSSKANFDHKVRTIRKGREDAIDITPRSTAALQLGVLRIETDCPIVKHRRKMAFFGVVKKKRRASK